MTSSYRFGRVEVRPAERQIVVEGQPATVGARAFDVLMALIDRRDRVVTKDELLDIVWPGLVVEENNLQVQVSTLRKVLGPRSVATIPGRGYRFTLQPEAPDAPLCDLSAPRHNLPAQLNRFIGREHEIGEVKALFASSRLVTLASLGGTGKTRLSLQVAHELVNQFPDGAWFVELAPVADETRVAHAIGAVLGVLPQSTGSVAEALAAYLRGRNMLLVLDNCEHVLHGAAEIVKHCLQAAPLVHVLVSSREPLRVSGEMVYPLSPLPTPDPRYATSTQILEQYDAVRLFVDRATAANTSFQLADSNVAAVATICRRLDGIPLAIELAAARVRALSVENIAARLNDRFRLLTGGDQTAAPRQQTLRASLDWSYELLTPAEASLLRRLAVFSGGWTLEAAEAICAAGEVKREEILELLTHLVEKSLVEIDAFGERYRLLETVRQYASEKLVAEREIEAVRQLHAAYYIEFARIARPHLTGPEEAEWMNRLDAELENLIAAHAASAIEGKLQLVASVRHYIVNRGLFELAHGLALEALSQAPAGSAARALALFHVGQIAFLRGRDAEARPLLEESLALARSMDDGHRIAAVLQPLGMVCLKLGDVACARNHLQLAVAMALERGNDRDTAAALTVLAQMHRALGDNETAARLYQEAVEYGRRLGDRELIAIELVNLAMASVQKPLSARAQLVLDALDLGEQVRSRYVGRATLDVATGIAALASEWKCCATLYGAAEMQGAHTGFGRDAADEAFIEPLVAAARETLGPAFAVGESEGRALGYEQALAYLRACLARIAAA